MASAISLGFRPLPTRKRVAERAYGLFQQRGSHDGNDWADWLEAEAMLFDEFFAAVPEGLEVSEEFGRFDCVAIAAR